MEINNWRNSSDWAVIDTETTGMGKKDQVIEITLMSSSGDILFNSLIKPLVPIHVNALNTHGINMDMLKDAPSWPEVIKDFEIAASKFKEILIYNKSFDIRLISQTYSAYNLVSPAYNYKCVMAAFSDYLKQINYQSKGRVSLDNACKIIGVDTEVFDRHRSYGDCFLTKELIINTPIIKTESKIDKISEYNYASTGIASIIDSSVSNSNSFVNLHSSLQESGVEIVLTGPNPEMKSFNGCVFYRGNEKISGSKIGKNYSLNKLIERGISYSEDQFDYLYNIHLNKIKLEQLNDLTSLVEINPRIMKIYDESKTPLKTTFKIFADYFDGTNSVRLIYKTGVLPNLHSQTKMYPDKIATMQLDQIKISDEKLIKLKYNTIYETKPNEASFVSKDENKNFIGHDMIKRALSVGCSDTIVKYIMSCIEGKMYSSSLTLNQYIFNQENKNFVKLERKTSNYKLIDFSISALLNKH